tara:strand:- start:823 stop:1545 length:723 start_codon:yes stop_codon:yes gene_type:complete
LNVVIDIGNTVAKIALFRENTFISKTVIDQLEVIEYIKNLVFDRGIISNVGKKNLEKKLLAFYPNLVSLNTQFKFPINFAYETMNSLGLDRIANAVGAYVETADKNSLIIDIGSCLTFDFIDSNNCYHGGAISPGLNMRFKALNNFTENLPLLNLNSSKLKLIGSATNSSIVSGVVNGTIAEIKYNIYSYREKFNNLNVFITGGDSDFIIPIAEFEKNTIFAVENLTLIGLNAILDYNDK